ncbi:MAG: hypothetical protein WBO24_02895 [Nitrospirales bacterium]
MACVQRLGADRYISVEAMGLAQVGARPCSRISAGASSVGDIPRLGQKLNRQGKPHVEEKRIAAHGSLAIVPFV